MLLGHGFPSRSGFDILELAYHPAGGVMGV
jgi:hypothetical protein